MLKMILVFLAYAATIPAANYLIANVGTMCIPDGPCLIPVGFGLMAPSGVLMIGLALVLRDAIHEIGGWRTSALAILVGCLLSLLFSDPKLAIASAVAFGLAEIADQLVYTPLRERGRSRAVIWSGLAGAALDSVLFVYLAFGSIEFSAGTTLAKVYASVAVAIFLYGRPRCWFGHDRHCKADYTTDRCSRCEAAGESGDR